MAAFMAQAPRFRWDPALATRLYEAAGAARWALAREAFEAALAAGAIRALGETTRINDAELEAWTRSLHLEDLALAAACADGSESAWEHFIAVYQPLLRRAADAMDRTGGARDLADSLIADLYGLDQRDGTRRSLFRYFHGRSQLGTWLRSVLSQRLVDRARATRRLEPLPDNQDLVLDPAGSPASHTERPRFQSALEQACAAAIADLAARDRLRLSCYYAQGMTLAAIGRMLREHEATVSRHLARTRASIRAAVDARLRADHGFDDRAVAECFQVVVEDTGTIDLGTLLGAPVARKIAPAARSEK
jgi:RNA polymerase sigma-70 factor, ECF subfamily